jgi:tetratricopeptide (TPR) repeat protein
VPGIREIAAAAALAVALAACAGPYQQGERLYRQGDIAGAIDVWRDIPAENTDYPKAHARLEALETELASSLARYEKRAQFFEDEGRLAEAVLYYRLALRLDPDRPQTLAKVQTLYRQLQAKTADERAKLASALAAGNLAAANESAQRLQMLDPFDPAIQIELRQVNAESGAQVLRWLEDGKRAYALGDRTGARSSFERVTELDPENEAALGYLSYLRRYDQDVVLQVPQPRPAETARAAGLPPPTLSPQDVLAEGRYRSGRQAEESGDPYRAIRE